MVRLRSIVGAAMDSDGDHIGRDEVVSYDYIEAMSFGAGCSRIWVLFRVKFSEVGCFDKLAGRIFDRVGLDWWHPCLVVFHDHRL